MLYRLITHHIYLAKKFENVRELLENASDDATILSTVKEFALPLIKAADNREIFENTLSTLQLQQQQLNNQEIINKSKILALEVLEVFPKV